MNEKFLDTNTPSSFTISDIEKLVLKIKEDISTIEAYPII